MPRLRIKADYTNSSNTTLTPEQRSSIDKAVNRVMSNMRSWTTYEVKTGVFTSVTKLDQFCDEHGIQHERTYVGGLLNPKYQYKVYVNQAERHAFERFMRTAR